jgi:GTPase SAR1 family protein
LRYAGLLISAIATFRQNSFETRPTPLSSIINISIQLNTMKKVEQINSSCDIKIILLGDSAVGKSKLMERYLLDDYIPYQTSDWSNDDIEGSPPAAA